MHCGDWLLFGVPDGSEGGEVWSAGCDGTDCEVGGGVVCELLSPLIGGLLLFAGGCVEVELDGCWLAGGRFDNECGTALVNFVPWLPQKVIKRLIYGEFFVSVYQTVVGDKVGKK